MKAQVCSGYDAEAVLRNIDDAVAAGLRPTVAFVFCSVAHDFEAVARAIAGRGIAVVGATTAGEITDGVLLEESCSALLMEVDPAAFVVELKSAAGGASLSSLAWELGAAAVARFERPVVFAFVSGIKADGEDVVHGIRAGAGRSIPVFGGMAGDDLRMKASYVFSGDGSADEGVVGLVLDGDRYEVEGIATSGWQPIGIEKTITRARANVVYTIDDEPALDVYAKYLGQREMFVNASGVQYPISIRRDDGTSVIRAPLLYDADLDAMIFAGTVPEGAKMKFCIPPSIDIVERVVEEASELRGRVPGAEALLLVSCVARHAALGPMSHDEVAELHDLWGAPMLGYLSYGEIGGNEPRHCDFHTETCVLVALREARG